MPPFPLTTHFHSLIAIFVVHTPSVYLHFLIQLFFRVNMGRSDTKDTKTLPHLSVWTHFRLRPVRGAPRNAEICRLAQCAQ